MKIKKFFANEIVILFLIATFMIGLPLVAQLLTTVSTESTTWNGEACDIFVLKNKELGVKPASSITKSFTLIAKDGHIMRLPVTMFSRYFGTWDLPAHEASESEIALYEHYFPKA